MPKYEMVMPGFNGGTDETDDRVLWIESDLPAADLEAQLKLHNVMDPATSLSELPEDADVDFRLPEQLAELVAHAIPIISAPAPTEELKHTPDAEWVLNFLGSIENKGNHAPTETMRRVADSQAKLIAAIEGILNTVVTNNDRAEIHLAMLSPEIQAAKAAVDEARA